MSSIAGRLSRNRPEAAVRYPLQAVVLGDDERVACWTILNVVQDWTCMGAGILFGSTPQIKLTSLLQWIHDHPASVPHVQACIDAARQHRAYYYPNTLYCSVLTADNT